MASFTSFLGFPITVDTFASFPLNKMVAVSCLIAYNGDARILYEILSFIYRELLSAFLYFFLVFSLTRRPHGRDDPYGKTEGSLLCKFLIVLCKPVLGGVFI